MDEFTDIQLIKKHLKRDSQAFELLISRYLKPIYSFIYRLVKNADEAEDITQEVFIKVWKNLKKFDQKKSFKIWLFTIAKNTVIDFFRKKKNILFSDLAPENDPQGSEILAIDSQPLPDIILDQEILEKKLAEIVEILPLKSREVLFLYYKEDLTFQEISDIFGESINTIKSRHYRAILALRDSISK
ncbi:MAG: hypothetical protein A2Y82_02030 [Candidatus Buchananbacteria bacterium RBG_13_36_9]|uniref:RNA polymerase sigma factor n=1 Tax=Candidatus Buchananbacteria bacterium RBG_13_36_9 TaxID=1797530 RepID=A0A1G1XNN3_9BACT|nr:MAG: hypothetical protein A2Y82_02030 [Candidatus Buchananbacteria bacterium RBG_13_36_9]